MRRYRRQALLLVLVMGIAALLAQVAGVGTTQPTAVDSTPVMKKLTTIPSGSVPDVGSSTLGSARIKAAAGETVRMRADAKLRVAELVGADVTQVVCGIRYSRDGDPGWSLGTPYETITLAAVGATDQVTLTRTFNAPAADTYRMKAACHVASPASGARVVASGSMRASRGMPRGAATPVT